MFLLLAQQAPAAPAAPVAQDAFAAMAASPSFFRLIVFVGIAVVVVMYYPKLVAKLKGWVQSLLVVEVGAAVANGLAGLQKRLSPGDQATEAPAKLASYEPPTADVAEVIRLRLAEYRRVAPKASEMRYYQWLTEGKSPAAAAEEYTRALEAYLPEGNLPDKSASGSSFR